jgi:hypothetical protein
MRGGYAAGALAGSGLLALLAVHSLEVSAGPPPASDAERFISATEGRYTERHQVRSADGDDAMTEDVVEIARFDPLHVYMRIDRHFDVGHSCGIAGIAIFEKNDLIYRTRRGLADEDATCTLTIRATGDVLRITDWVASNGVPTCQAFCGRRGSLSDFMISRAQRRPIPDLTELTRSDEYIDAVAEFNEHARVR